MAKCPIYDIHSACDIHRDCLFLRQGGCAIVLAATTAVDNNRILEDLKRRLSSLESNLAYLASRLK